MIIQCVKRGCESFLLLQWDPRFLVCIASFTAEFGLDWLAVLSKFIKTCFFFFLSPCCTKCESMLQLYCVCACVLHRDTIIYASVIGKHSEHSFTKCPVLNRKVV